MKRIPLSQGHYALVDDRDYRRLVKYKWHISRCNGILYAERSYGPRKDRHNERMHREIMSTPKGMVTDHINGNGLDNRRVNLRICTQSENLMNKRMQSNNSSGFTGVMWHPPSRRWMARIGVRRKYTVLGYFKSKAAAASTYEKGKQVLHGDFSSKRN